MTQNKNEKQDDLRFSMEDYCRSGLHDFDLASRKAEEAAWRRYEAAEWLESLVGPLGISNQPSESEFIFCLKNGLILCKAINKINPRAVPKVVENQEPSQSLTRDLQPLPAYQHFENVRNFLVAVEELKLPTFEASDLERDTLETGSASKVVDCILALKSYHEWKQTGSENGFNKHIRSPLVMHSANRMISGASAAPHSDTCRRLDMSATSEKQFHPDGVSQRLQGELVELIVNKLAHHMDEAKENLDRNLSASFRSGYRDPIKLFSAYLSNYLGEELQKEFPELALLLKDLPSEKSSLPSHPPSDFSDGLSVSRSPKFCRACASKGTCSHQRLFKKHEKELVDLKDLLSKIKEEYEEMQCQIQSSLNNLGSQVEELSTAVSGYHKVVKENRNLYNMVQDLKGNIRVYCRIRPSFRPESKNVVGFIGEDGSLVILDPLKTQKDGRKVFQFNRVFGPMASQDEVFMDIQPLIRSVMDGYNVCIFAYGQTGSGKTYTMSGPSGRSSKDLGINYLALSDLFRMSNKRKETVNYDIYVQMVEIYNEQVRDLLAEEASNRLEIHSCNDNGMSLPDGTLLPVKSTTDVLNLMKLGEFNRAVSSTAINSRSSRSHSVLTVHVHGKDVSGSTIRSCLHLVDLAGSERVDKSEVTGERLKEAQYINKSLSCLGDVITALAQKNSHIPYRNSKLTLLLQDSLGGHAKTLMFAHVSPEDDSFGETVSTLKFAQRVSTVELGAARSNKESSEVMQLREQVESLKMALANKEAQRLQLNRTKEPHTPTDKPPLRLRRLSIENCSVARTDKSKKPEVRSSTKSPSFQTRSRRLSLEGSKCMKKDSLLPKASPEVSKTLQFEPMQLQKCCSFQDAEAATKLSGHISHSSSKLEMHSKAPWSPTNIGHQKRPIEIDGATQIPALRLPKTPEPVVHARNDAHKIALTDLPVPSDSQTPNITSSTNGKGSQIRRSLRTIGKLINGPEKRSQKNLNEAKSPVKGNIRASNDTKSPPTARVRANRRQSLTGISGSHMLRRCSLGGKPMDSIEKERNAKTPPPERSATKTAKRRM